MTLHSPMRRQVSIQVRDMCKVVLLESEGLRQSAEPDLQSFCISSSYESTCVNNIIRTVANSETRGLT